MLSIWDAPSDRDYYDQFGPGESDEEPEYCADCGARSDKACEEWCSTNAPASEPAPTDDATLSAEPIEEQGTVRKRTNPHPLYVVLE